MSFIFPEMFRDGTINPLGSPSIPLRVSTPFQSDWNSNRQKTLTTSYQCTSVPFCNCIVVLLYIFSEMNGTATDRQSSVGFLKTSFRCEVRWLTMYKPTIKACIFLCYHCTILLLYLFHYCIYFTSVLLRHHHH